MDFLGSGGNPQYFNRYAYTFNDPVNNLDPDGNVVETVWDAANVALGAASTANNLKQGNYGAAAIDAIGTVVDAAATVVPFVPGGASTAIKGGRAIGAAADASKARKGASGSLTTAAGDTVAGNSTKASRTGGAPQAPTNPQMKDALDNVTTKSGTHGACCEIDAMNKVLNDGGDLSGAKMGTVTDNITGAAKDPCSSCREVMEHFGVE